MATLEELEAEQARRSGGGRLQELEAELSRRQNPPKSFGVKGALFGAVNSIADKISGKKFREHDYPDIGQVDDTGLTFGQEGKVALSKTFGNEKDIAIRLKSMGVEVKVDSEGAPFVETPDGPAYLNRPGLDINDVLSAVGQGLAYAGGAAAAPAKGTLLRMLGVGAGTAGVDVAAQKLAGRDEVDVGQTAMVAGMGAAAEGLAPIVMKIAQAMKGKPKAEVGREIARQMGLGQVDDATAIQLAKEAERGMTRQAAQAKAQGFRPTRGQKTGDFDQLAVEERLRSTPNSGGRMIRDNDAINEQALAKRLDELQDRIGRGGSLTAEDAAQVVSNEAKGVQEAMRQATGDAYKEVGQAFVEKTAIKSFDKTISKLPELQRAARNPRVYPNTSMALKEIKRQSDSLPDNVVGVRIDAVEDTRKMLSGLRQGASPQDRRAMSQLIDEFDNWQQNVPLQGDQAAVESFKIARAAHALERSKFSPKDAKDIGAKVAGEIAEGNLSAREVAARLFGDGAQPKANAHQVVKHMKSVLGEKSEGWKAMREMVFLKMTQNRLGDFHQPRTIISNIRSMVQGRNKQFAEEVFSHAQILQLGRFSNALEAITPKGIQARSSGTAERVIRTALDKAKLGTLVDWINANQALSPLPANLPKTPAVVPGLAASQANDPR